MLDDLTVQPGESAEVEDASAFEDSPLWQVSGQPKKRTSSKPTRTADTDGETA